MWGLAVGKLVISVKNTGKRLFAEIYGTSHGWDATRFKIDIERGILQVHEGCSGFSHRSGEQAWLKTDVRPGPEMRVVCTAIESRLFRAFACVNGYECV